MGMTDSHMDPDFCLEMGEQVVNIQVSKPLLLKSNGPQGDVYRNNHKAGELRCLGTITARNLLQRRILREEHGTMDLLCLIHYPKRMSRADPPNLWPTVKHLEDGMTDAHLWPDDDATHIRRHMFQLHPTPTGIKGLWRFEFHIIHTGDDDELAITGA